MYNYFSSHSFKTRDEYFRSLTSRQNVMYKIINLFLVILVILFFFNSYKKNLSNKKIKNIDIKPSNIEEIIERKISHLPILDNDTNNVIEFNTSTDEIKNDERRNFWDLLKIK